MIDLVVAAATLALSIAAFLQVRQGRATAAGLHESRIADVQPVLHLLGITEIEHVGGGLALRSTVRNVGNGPGLNVHVEIHTVDAKHGDTWTGTSVVDRVTDVLKQGSEARLPDWPDTGYSGAPRLEVLTVSIGFDDITGNRYVGSYGYRRAEHGVVLVRHALWRLLREERSGLSFDFDDVRARGEQRAHFAESQMGQQAGLEERVGLLKRARTLVGRPRTEKARQMMRWE